MIQAGAEQVQGVPMRHFQCVLLAGALTPSPLRQSLDIPVLCLPLSRQIRLLDLWLRVIDSQAGCSGVKIVVSSDMDAQRVQQVIDQRDESGLLQPTLAIEVLVDPHEYRGPAGRLRDIADTVELAEDAALIVGEASSHPPLSLHGVLAGLTEDVVGIVGTSAAREPAGLYAFTEPAIEVIPRIGFFDLKEQWLPALYERGLKVGMHVTVEQLLRIRDRSSYLAAVRRHIGAADDRSHTPSETRSASAHVCPRSLIGDGVVIEDGAIIKDSVVMGGATIGSGAVVHRSIVGPSGVVPPRARACSTVVADARPARSNRVALRALRKIAAQPVKVARG